MSKIFNKDGRGEAASTIVCNHNNWVEKTKEKFPQFLYDKTEYINNNIDVIITCPIHGDFLINPKYFIQKKKDCPTCAQEKNLDKKRDKIIEKCLKTHSDKNYIYHKDTIHGVDYKMTVTCPIHGDFYPTPSNHINKKSICPMCSRKEQGLNERITIDEFKRRSNDIFKEKYSYELIKELNGIDAKVPIICKEHGVFYQSPHAHMSGNGCPKCARINNGLLKRSKQEDVINRFNNIFNSKYDYSEFVYVTTDTKSVVICHKMNKNGKEHGRFYIRPMDHLQGNGCPLCHESKLERDVRNILDKYKIEYISQASIRNGLAWLGLQSLDFYLPKHGIAIECQGEQHFEDRNGKYDIGINKKRDILKKQKCKDNNVRLIYYFNKYYEKYMTGDDEYCTDINEIINKINNVY